MIVYDKVGNHKVISNLDSSKYNFNVRDSYKGTENKVELNEASGFVDIKIEKYGDALLKIINE